MQVTHVSDQVTHAVIGGSKAREFGISNSAEFFNILSNTLYSDKILAVVREVLCNAWDIHIETGITNKPVKITLHPDKLIIRDFGTGIADDEIVNVYGTYGNSTKKLDGKQTGGFGLGSKAPFAYVDHFEVTSYYKGTKTIYNMSKSSGEVAGKPSIQTVVAVPTTESGLQVQFNIANRTDYERFREVIHTIAKFGEMNVELNDAPILTIPFSKAKHGFLLCANMHGISGYQTHSIFVRYGNVVYPIESTQEYITEFNEVNAILDQVSTNSRYSGNKDYSLILQAKPNTISVTPSRESLSMTDHTISSIKELLFEFTQVFEQNIEQSCIKIRDEAIAEAWLKKDVGRLLNSDNKIIQYNSAFSRGEKLSVISDINELAPVYANKAYPNFKSFRKDDIVNRLNILIKNDYGNKGKLQTFREYYKIHGNTVTDWFQRRYVLPLLKKMEGIKEVQPSKLLVYGKHDTSATGTRDGRYNYQWREANWVEATKLSVRTLEMYLPFLRNFLVLAYSRKDVEDRIHGFPEISGSIKEDFLAYIAPRNVAKTDAIRDFFKNQGFIILDMTKVNSWENPTVVNPQVNTKPKPKKKGLPILSSGLWLNTTTDKTTLRLSNYQKDDVERIEKPEFVVKISGQYGSSDLKYFHTQTGQKIVHLFGKLGGVVVNVNQQNRFIGLGAKPFIDWLFERITLEIQTNKNIERKISLMLRESKLSYNGNQLIEAITDNAVLADHYKVSVKLTPDEQDYFDIISELYNSYNFKNRPEYKPFRDAFEAIKVDPNLAKLTAKIGKIKIPEIINSRTISTIITEKNKNEPEFAKIIDILDYLIEG